MAEIAALAVSSAESPGAASSNARCRFCEAPLTRTFVNLGMSPLANHYLRAEELNEMEAFFPLHVYLCEHCYLVQLQEYEAPDRIFSDYAYFSSFSQSWLEHGRALAQDMVARLALGPQHEVTEIASNDGYLLQYFKENGVKVMGIEPAANIALVAQQKGIPTIPKFFGVQTAKEVVAAGHRPDLLIAINVMPHVPNLNDFVQGLKVLLKPGGVLCTQFQYFVPFVLNHEWDTIYHEHFSYLSFITIEKVLKHHGLVPFDVQELPQYHGGSIRILSRHLEDASRPVSQNVDALRAREEKLGVDSLAFYQQFHEKVDDTKRDLLEFLIGLKRQGKQIVGYGAPAKGNTLLNYCGIGTDFLDYTVDLNPAKQGRYLPGTHIPIYAPDKLKETRPDYVLILPWNLKDEIVSQTRYIRDWGGKHVIPIPTVKVLD